MAGGEKAKSSGEYGEKIVKRLLEMFGWTMADSGVTIKCVRTKKHSDKDNTRIKHGIDYVYQYKSKLIDNTRQDVLISVKCRDKYPTTSKGVKSKFKEFYEDIYRAAECYPSSDLYKRKIQGTKSRKIDGVIFWIDRNSNTNTEYNSLVDGLGNIRLPDTTGVESLSLVDNKRAQFLYESINFVFQEYGKENVEFFYLDTGLNNSSLDKIYSGKEMPIEYISTSILPFLANVNGNTTFILVTEEPFNENYLKRLISLSHLFTRELSSEVMIVFQDYHDMEHSEAVRDAFNSFSSEEYIKKIKIRKMHFDFRDGVFNE